MYNEHNNTAKATPDFLKAKKFYILQLQSHSPDLIQIVQTFQIMKAKKAKSPGQASQMKKLGSRDEIW